MILRKRAEEIMSLVRKTEAEISIADDAIAGDIYIGAGYSSDELNIVATYTLLLSP
jgi:hypothetical protein